MGLASTNCQRNLEFCTTRDIQGLSWIAKASSIYLTTTTPQPYTDSWQRSMRRGKGGTGSTSLGTLRRPPRMPGYPWAILDVSNVLGGLASTSYQTAGEADYRS